MPPAGQRHICVLPHRKGMGSLWGRQWGSTNHGTGGPTTQTHKPKVYARNGTAQFNVRILAQLVQEES